MVSDMLKILKTDFYRLFHGVAFYIFPVLMLVTDVFNFVLDKITGTTYGENLSMDFFNVCEEFEMCIPLFFVCGVLIVMFIQENSNAYRKNILGNVSRKYYTTISKMIIGVFLMVIYFIVDFLGNLADGFIRGAEWVKISDLTIPADGTIEGVFYEKGTVVCSRSDQICQGLKVLFTVIMIYLAFIMLVILINELTHSCLLNCVLVFGLLSELLEELFAGGIHFLQEKLEILPDFEICEYLLRLGADRGRPTYSGTVIIMASIYIVLFGALSIIIIQKKDVT